MVVVNIKLRPIWPEIWRMGAGGLKPTNVVAHCPESEFLRQSERFLNAACLRLHESPTKITPRIVAARHVKLPGIPSNWSTSGLHPWWQLPCGLQTHELY